MASRRKSRELALQMLFQWEMGQHPPEHVVATFLKNQKLEPEVANFARTLFEGTVGEIKNLDRLVREQSEHWRPSAWRPWTAPSSAWHFMSSSITRRRPPLW